MSNITSLEPLHQLTPKIELSTEDMIAELRKRWAIKDWSIIV